MLRLRRWIPLLLLCGGTLLTTNCQANVRDAARWGAMNFVSNQTTNVLYWLIPPPEPRTR